MWGEGGDEGEKGAWKRTTEESGEEEEGEEERGRMRGEEGEGGWGAE